MHRIGPLMLCVGLLALSPTWPAMSAAAPPTWPAMSAAAPPTLLVANVELVDLAPPDQQYDQAQDAARAAMLSRRVRGAVVSSEKYKVIDRQPQDRQPPYNYMACKACIFDWARKRGARYVLVTWVQKESRLILMVNMALIDVTHPDQQVRGGSVDLRGDTDATWLAGASQMLDRTLGVAMQP